jgi:hypothetical protein
MQLEKEEFKKIPETKILLPIIIISSILIKLHYLPFELPLTSDAFTYFEFAVETSVLKQYPEIILPNDGWSLFLSFFFSILPSSNFMDFMNLQRLISIVLSTLTIIPVYFIAKRFVSNPYALVAALIFAFEPRIIENSILGITEPLYILLGSLVLCLFLTNESKKIYLSFLFVALFTIVRTEGIVLFFAISIIFLFRNKIKKSSIKQYLISISIFLVALISILLIRIEKTGYNHIFDRIGIYSSNLIVESNNENLGIYYFMEGIINFIKFLGWDLIPIFIFCVPIGFFIMLKNRKWDNLTIIFSTIILCIPIYYIYSAGVNDSKYFYALYPIFCIYFVVGLNKIVNKRKKEKLILVVIGIIIISGSLIFTDYRKMDIDNENNVIEVIDIIIEKTEVVNEFWPESRYIQVKKIFNLELFPTSIFELNYHPKLIYEKTTTLEEYLESGKTNGLTHLIVDEKEDPTYRMVFLKDIFDNENKYPCLVKIFDSKNDNNEYRVKIFKIDYEKLGICSVKHFEK